MENFVSLPSEVLIQQIFYLRGKKVMFDYDLARLYDMETRVLKQQVRRNLDRFPDDFMFILSENETDEMVSHFVIPSKSYLGGSTPMAFTELGVAMLSSVLKSKRALLVNITIMRVFVNLRQLFDSNRDLSRRIDTLEEKYDNKFMLVFDAIKELIHKENEPRERIGYKIPGSG